MNNPASRPEIETLRDNVADYDMIYDAYTDGDAYCNRQYIENFRQLCDMIHCDNSPVKITYIREKDKVEEGIRAYG